MIKIHWYDERMEDSIMEFNPKHPCNSCTNIGSYFDVNEEPSFTFGGSFCKPIGTCKECLLFSESEPHAIDFIEWEKNNE